MPTPPCRVLHSIEPAKAGSGSTSWISLDRSLSLLHPEFKPLNKVLVQNLKAASQTQQGDFLIP